ncbi:hypothetical protein DPMN_061205 [Dreissena polymorpha]|uniref:Uncharacterized protein n=1 Tax=Dreissena polymorpha TaxID=45954 RepID=A0A9D4HIY7_DREPO|nr:hypothetical protein DPMN_061205 [Dreissena polymorpha]
MSDYYVNCKGSVFRAARMLTSNSGAVKSLMIDRAITAICFLSNDQIFVAYQYCNNIKILNHQYQVVSEYTFTAHPHDICQITPSEVAVVVNDDKTHEVQFVSVNDGRLVIGTNLNFEHSYFGIARYRKNLYLTAGTALYKYSISGTRLNKLYQDKTAGATGNIK